MVRKTTVFIDPNLFESGSIAQSTGRKDNYFSSDSEDVVRMVLDNFIKQLPPLKHAAIEMCVMSKITYEEAAHEISLKRGVETDKKTVWRWAQSAVEELKEWLMDSPWVSAITQGKIPVDMLDASLPILLPPWEEDDGS